MRKYFSLKLFKTTSRTNHLFFRSIDCDSSLGKNILRDGTCTCSCVQSEIKQNTVFRNQFNNWITQPEKLDFKSSFRRGLLMIISWCIINFKIHIFNGVPANNTVNFDYCKQSQQLKLQLTFINNNSWMIAYFANRQC